MRSSERDVVVGLEAVTDREPRASQRVDCRCDVELAPAAERVPTGQAVAAAVGGRRRASGVLEQLGGLVGAQPGRSANSIAAAADTCAAENDVPDAWRNSFGPQSE